MGIRLQRVGSESAVRENCFLQRPAAQILPRRRIRASRPRRLLQCARNDLLNSVRSEPPSAASLLLRGNELLVNLKSFLRHFRDAFPVGRQFFGQIVQIHFGLDRLRTELFDFQFQGFNGFHIFLADVVPAEAKAIQVPRIITTDGHRCTRITKICQNISHCHD